MDSGVKYSIVLHLEIIMKLNSLVEAMEYIT